MLKIKSFVFNPIQENTYILYNEQKQCAIFDPGCYSDNENDELKKFISAEQLTPILLLNTHCHLDHVFGNKFIADTYNLPLFIHPNEKIILDNAPTAGLMYNMPFDNYQGEINYLHEGDFLKIGNDELYVIEAPGHSPGHVCFYCKAQNFIIGGDVLFNGSIGRTDLPGGNYETLIKNIKEKLLILPSQTKVYSGHGMATNIEFEKRNNPYLQ